MKTKIFLDKIFYYLGVKLSNLQGKGWGGATVDKESDEFFTATNYFAKRRIP
jgi:hypothetical protein